MDAATEPHAHYRRVVLCVSKILNVPQEQISLQNHLIKDLGADSMALFALKMELQKEFSIRFTDNHLHNMLTIKGLCNLVAKAQ